MRDVNRIAQVLAKRFAGLKPMRNYGWPVPPLDVLDCVLSLNRPYYRFVKPRVEDFAERHPTLTTLRGLKRIIDSYPSPLSFSVKELRYRDPGRADTLVGVVNYLLRNQSRYTGTTEWARLHCWAKKIDATDYKSVGVRGFGIAGFQYLRILFGANTSKPDVHIKRFVSRLLGRRVNEVETICLLERAAKLTGVPLREADNAIWRQLSMR
jgi:hypothetical protein